MGREETTRMRLPLEDVTVIDLSHALAGPFCSTMLADFGARVIKLEPKGAGDIARAWGTPLPGGETAYFVSLHRNKQGIEVDLKHPRGRALFFELVERADVVLENYRTGALERLGLAYAEARQRNPGIIYCSVSGFGQDGPYRDRAALDLILQAESGMISVTGEEGGRGVRAGTSIADMTAGMYAAFGIMLALRVKERTGRGQATAYKALLPYQTFRTRTRDLALAVGSEKLWQIFCPAIGRPELADDPRYRRNADRARNRASLIPLLQEVFLTKTYEEWEAIFLPRGIPFGAINTIAQVVEHPQVKARGALVEMEHPRAGKVKMVGAPVRLSETPGSVRTPSPMLGEHTETVLRELLGLSPQAIAALREEGVIGGPATSGA
jgi:formyl-CoA transferase/CoA:oxalate CoA-transferase